MGLLRRAARVFGFGHSHDHAKVAEAAKELRVARTELRETVSGLGQEVWGMVETGDPLRALVHGAQNAQFRREIGEGNEGLND